MKQVFKKCPECTSTDVDYDGMKRHRCLKCGWEYYHNTATAVAGILERDGKFLAVRRNLPPGKGLLDLPGGFVDPHESAEDALRREVREELDSAISDLRYLCSSPNVYHYKEVDYSTCDIVFVAKIEGDSFTIDTSEISSYHWLDKNEVNMDDFAFVSIKAGIKAYLES